MRTSCPLGALPQPRPNKGSSLASPQTMAKGRVRSGHVLTCGVAAIANGFMEVLPPCIEALPQRVPRGASYQRTQDWGVSKHTDATGYEHETGYRHGAWSQGSQRQLGLGLGLELVLVLMLGRAFIHFILSFHSFILADPVAEG